MHVPNCPFCVFQNYNVLWEIIAFFSIKYAQIVKKLSQAIYKTRGINAKTIGIGGGTVGAELRREGIEAAVWSTLEDMAHQPNEYCVIQNMIDDAITLAVLFNEE